VLAKVDPATAIAPLQTQLGKGSTAERQGAISVLTTLPGEVAQDELLAWLDRLIAGRVPEEIHLDLIEAAAKRSEPELRRKVEQYESSRPRNDPLRAYREVLFGGDAQRGSTIYTKRSDLECVRCHKIKERFGESFGGEVGPELSGVGARQTRTYLLESLLDPNKRIAQGFESVVLATSDGMVFSGVLRGEDAHEVRLVNGSGEVVSVPKDAIEERSIGPSAMPNDLVQKLSKSELRDLIEFLANLKTP
jgi:quinoprotein glucose dehydrogenase